MAQMNAEYSGPLCGRLALYSHSATNETTATNPQLHQSPRGPEISPGLLLSHSFRLPRSVSAGASYCGGL